MRMEAKDESLVFNFGGNYDEVIINQLIPYSLGDGRKVPVTFLNLGDVTKVSEIFEAEFENPIEL